MPPITRIGDNHTGHDLCPPVPAVQGSPNFFVGGKNVVRVGDSYAVHGCPVHAPHAGKLSSGAPHFYVNGIPVGRIGDPVNCGASVAQGDNTFIVGNGGGS